MPGPLPYSELNDARRFDTMERYESPMLPDTRGQVIGYQPDTPRRRRQMLPDATPPGGGGPTVDPALQANALKNQATLSRDADRQGYMANAPYMPSARDRAATDLVQRNTDSLLQQLPNVPGITPEHVQAVNAYAKGQDYDQDLLDEAKAKVTARDQAFRAQGGMGGLMGAWDQLDRAKGGNVTRGEVTANANKEFSTPGLTMPTSDKTRALEADATDAARAATGGQSLGAYRDQEATRDFAARYGPPSVAAKALPAAISVDGKVDTETVRQSGNTERSQAQLAAKDRWEQLKSDTRLNAQDRDLAFKQYALDNNIDYKTWHDVTNQQGLTQRNDANNDTRRTTSENRDKTARDIATGHDAAAAARAYGQDQTKIGIAGRRKLGAPSPTAPDRSAYLPDPKAGPPLAATRPAPQIAPLLTPPASVTPTAGPSQLLPTPSTTQPATQPSLGGAQSSRAPSMLPTPQAPAARGSQPTELASMTPREGMMMSAKSGREIIFSGGAWRYVTSGPYGPNTATV